MPKCDSDMAAALICENSRNSWQTEKLISESVAKKKSEFSFLLGEKETKRSPAIFTHPFHAHCLNDTNCSRALYFIGIRESPISLRSNTVSFNDNLAQWVPDAKCYGDQAAAVSKMILLISDAALGLFL